MTITDTVNNWTKDTLKALNDNYNRLGLRASGNWSQELDSNQRITDQEINIQILAPRYTGALVDGRSPNRNQSPDSIRAFVGWAGNTWLKDWVESKGVAASPFAVAYKIAREGIKVPNANNPGTLLSDVFTQERIKDLVQSVGNVVSVKLKSDIKNIF